MKYIILPLLLLILFVQNSFANETITTSECSAWINEFINTQTTENYFVDPILSEECLAQIYPKSLSFQFNSLFTSKEAAIAAFNIISTDFKATEDIDSVNFLDKVLKGLNDYIVVVCSSVAFFIALLTAFMFIKNTKDKTDEYEYFSFRFYKPTYLLAALALSVIPVANTSFIFLLILILVTFSVFIELKLTLIVLPSFFAMFYSAGGGDINPNVINNANYLIEQSVVIKGLQQKQCEITNRDNLILQLSKSDELRSKTTVSSAQEILDCFNDESQSTNTTGLKAFGESSKRFNMCYSKLTDNAYKIDCGYIRNDENQSALIEKYDSKINDLFSEVYAYNCAKIKKSGDRLNNSQKDCIDIKDGKIQSDENGFLKYISKSLNYDEINKHKRELAVLIRKDIELKDFTANVSKIKELAVEQLNLVKYIGSASIPVSIVNATRATPTYFDYLKIFEKYEIIVERFERKGKYSEYYNNSQTNTDSLFIAQQDKSLDDLIGIQTFKENNQLNMLMAQGSYECMKNKGDCESVKPRDLGNMQNIIINNLNTLNTANWSLRVAGVLDPSRKAFWNQVSNHVTLITLVMYLFIFVTLFLAPWLFIIKFMGHNFKNIKSAVSIVFAILDIAMSVFFVDKKSSFKETSNAVFTQEKLVNLKQIFFNLTLDRYIYLVCWGVSFSGMWFLISELTKVSFFETQANIEGTIFGSISAFLSLFFFIAIVVFCQFILIVLPEKLTNGIFQTILGVNREVGIDSKLMQSTQSGYSKFKRWARLFI